MALCARPCEGTSLKLVVIVWSLTAPKDRRLLFLWLANDIVQTSKKKGNEFVKEFGKLLDSCIPFVYRYFGKPGSGDGGLAPMIDLQLVLFCLSIYI